LNRSCAATSWWSELTSRASPAGVDPDTVKAAYHDGVLEITMKAPKGLVWRTVPVTVH